MMIRFYLDLFTDSNPLLKSDSISFGEFYTIDEKIKFSRKLAGIRKCTLKSQRSLISFGADTLVKLELLVLF